jgi:hypothetical protein
MATWIERLKQLLGKSPSGTGGREQRRRRRDPDHLGRSSVREIEEASPEKAGELAGHAVERVET